MSLPPGWIEYKTDEGEVRISPGRIINRYFNLVSIYAWKSIIRATTITRRLKKRLGIDPPQWPLSPPRPPSPPPLRPLPPLQTLEVM
jgi:hypothetical protein